MEIILLLVGCYFAVILYNRLIPVRGITCSPLVDERDTTVKIIDVRDYNQSYKDPISNAINMPVSYLKRYYEEIGDSKVYIVASDQVEKNLSIRFLRKKGFDIVGYGITGCNDRDLLTNNKKSASQLCKCH